jgi:hypothetical protein
MFKDFLYGFILIALIAGGFTSIGALSILLGFRASDGMFAVLLVSLFTLACIALGGIIRASFDW